MIIINLSLKKNKFVILFIILSFVLILSGCESSDVEKDNLFNQLKRQKIIDNDYKLIDVVTESGPALEHCSSSTYNIYQNNNGNMIAIHYESGILKDCNCKHIVSIYYSVTKQNDYKLLTSDMDEANCWEHTYYKYENGDLTDKNKYSLNGNTRVYYVHIKKSYFGTKYIFSNN